MLAVVVVVVVAGMIFSVGCASCENCRNCRNCRDCRGDAKDAVSCDLDRDLDRDRGSTGGIRVESARYGRDDVWVDVTPQVRELVNADTIVFPRDLHATFNVDPIPGRMKYVEMTIIVDGRVMEMTVGDSLHVTPLRLRAGDGGGGAERGGATTREETSK
jgi:hypothetical protein